MEKKISPLNQAIENILFYIESNNLKGDNLLPSERYFSQNLNISRTTVRRALSKLIKQGKIYKEENKGYFVSPQKILRNVQDIYSTTQFFKSTNANLITKVLSINEILATKFLSRKLKLQLGTSISVLKRLRLLDGTPVILETSYIPTKFFSKISNVNFETNSLYSSFEQVGLTVEKGIETIEVVPPTDDDQLILKVNSDQKIFITSISVLKRLRLLDGTPVILETSYIPTKFFSKISNVNFETNSLYSSFEQVGLTVEKGIETIEVVPPTDDDQLILKVNSDQKIFITRGNTFLENDEPIEYFNMKMVGKIIKFITELT